MTAGAERPLPPRVRGGRRLEPSLRELGEGLRLGWLRRAAGTSQEGDEAGLAGLAGRCQGETPASPALQCPLRLASQGQLVAARALQGVWEGGQGCRGSRAISVSLRRTKPQQLSLPGALRVACFVPRRPYPVLTLLHRGGLQAAVLRVWPMGAHETHLA